MKIPGWTLKGLGRAKFVPVFANKHLRFVFVLGPLNFKGPIIRIQVT